MTRTVGRGTARLEAGHGGSTSAIDVVGVDGNAEQADALTSLVTQDIYSGKNVVLVARSQGNYFA